MSSNNKIAATELATYGAIYKNLFNTNDKNSKSKKKSTGNKKIAASELAMYGAMCKVRVGHKMPTSIKNKARAVPKEENKAYTYGDMCKVRVNHKMPASIKNKPTTVASKEESKAPRPANRSTACKQSSEKKSLFPKIFQKKATVAPSTTTTKKIELPEEKKVIFPNNDIQNTSVALHA